MSRREPITIYVPPADAIAWRAEARARGTTVEALVAAAVNALTAYRGRRGRGRRAHVVTP